MIVFTIMKNRVIHLVAFLLSASILVSCSKAGNAESLNPFYFQALWPLLVLALLSAIGAVPYDSSSDRAGMRMIAGLISMLAQLGGSILCIAGFWRWDIPWWQTLCILTGYGILARSTANTSDKGLSAFIKLICAILAVAACVFAYIKLW